MSDYFTYPAKGLNVVDGDTFDLFVDQGFEDYKKIRVRLKGVDTSEIYGVRKDSEEYQTGMEQKRFVKDFLEVGEHEEFEFPVTVRTVERGKYGRWVGHVWKDGKSLSGAIVEEWPEAESS